jgi:hypothetical protein
MARLTHAEKAALLAGIRPPSRTPQPAPPPLPKLSPREYLDFATQVSRLTPTPKPVRFAGDQWRL